MVGRGSTDCSLDGGVTATQNLLTAHPNINFLYSGCGEGTLGAAEVLKRDNLTGR